jgi:hypothetical protein
VQTNWVHQVIVADTLELHPLDWRLQAPAFFDLLSSQCRLAQITTNDAIKHFIVQSVVTSALLTETNFDTQLNTTLTQFIQSTTIRYRQLIETMRLVTQVDQPFTGPTNRYYPFSYNSRLVASQPANSSNHHETFQVRLS